MKSSRFDNNKVENGETDPVLDTPGNHESFQKMYPMGAAGRKKSLFTSFLTWTCVVLVTFTAGRYFSKSNKSAGGFLGNSSKSMIVEDDDGAVVLITGATGRTGSRLYHELKKREKVSEVRALVRDVEKAKDVLGCGACDETEGIYVGDVTKPEDLNRVMKDGAVSILAIAVGAGSSTPKEMQRAVEFDSVINSVRVLADTSTHEDLRVVFCSSMGTTRPPSDPMPFGGDVFFWKLNAEAFLSSSGIASVAIVKPCGLTDTSGKNSTLFVGHHDEPSEYHMVTRDDVARVMAEAALIKGENLRFDLCSKPGPPNKCLMQLIKSSKWEWQK